MRAEEHACYVNKHRQNVGLETWRWRQICDDTQRAHTKCKLPPYATEWKHSTLKFSAHATGNHQNDYIMHAAALKI